MNGAQIWALHLLGSIALPLHTHTGELFPDALHTIGRHELFPFSRIRNCRMVSTASFPDGPHTSVQHSHEKFYHRAANSEVDTITANL